MSQKRLASKPHPFRTLGRVLYRMAVVFSAIVVITYAVYKIYVRPPEVRPPDVPTFGNQSDNSSVEDPPHTGPVRRDLVYTFLLMGVDKGNGNADTIMVATYDVKEHTVGVVSIPRDTIVERSWSRYPKINAAYGGGGVELVRKEVSYLLGIPIDYHIKIDLKGFIALVDEVGGVDFEVPADMDYDDPWQDLSIHFKKGMQHLNGQQAMEVVRFRHNNDNTGYSDIGRTHTQQALLTAVAKKVLSLNSATKLTEFVDIFRKYVETDIPLRDMVYFATQALYVDTNSGVATRTLSGRGDAKYNGYSWCYELNKEQTLADINELLNPYTTPVTEELTHIVKATS